MDSDSTKTVVVAPVASLVAASNSGPEQVEVLEEALRGEEKGE